MRIYFAADHAGFEMKKQLMDLVHGELGHEIVDCGAFEFDLGDDYPQLIASAARQLSSDWAQGLESRAILLGASGQGEAIVANRFKGVRATVYYGGDTEQTDASGKKLDMIASSREHGNSNALSLGARFLTEDEAKKAVKKWLETPYTREERHERRIIGIDAQI